MKNLREFKPLKPQGLPEGFDATAETEAPIVKIEESVGKIVVSYAFPGFYLVEETAEVNGKKIAFKRPSMKAVGSYALGGKPLLPSFSRYVQIPKNCDYKVTAKKSNQVQFDNIDLYPAQTKLFDNVRAKEVFEYDSAFYGKDEYYPAEVFEVKGPFEIDDYYALLLSVMPLQYNPRNKQIVGWSNIEVTIEVTQKPSPDASPETPVVSKEAYGNLLLNPKRNINERLLPTTATILPIPIPVISTGPGFIIIYADNQADPAKDLKNAAQTLASWKNMIGLSTEIVPVSTVKAIPLSTTIQTDVDKMKSYIRGRRGQFLSALRYVLLLGDENTIPSEKFLENNGYVEYRYTDFYYSTQNDWIPGTYTFPWLAIGRITASTLQMATDAVNKLIAYEKTPPTDPSYYEKITLAAWFSAIPGTQNQEDSLTS